MIFMNAKCIELYDFLISKSISDLVLDLCTYTAFKINSIKEK